MDTDTNMVPKMGWSQEVGRRCIAFWKGKMTKKPLDADERDKAQFICVRCPKVGVIAFQDGQNLPFRN